MPSLRNKQLTLITSLSALLLAHAAWATHWHSGDLLFIETPCGAFCDAITSSTQSHYPLHFNHVAMIISSSQHDAPQIIEATTQGVHITSLPSFIQEHEVTKHNILIGRIKPTFAHLIPSSLRYARAQVNKPYNATFDDHTGQSYYCSQLIENSFYMANHHHRVFQAHPYEFQRLKHSSVQSLLGVVF